MDYKKLILELECIHKYLIDTEFSSLRTNYIKILINCCNLELNYLKEVKEANKEILRHLQVLTMPSLSDQDITDWFPLVYSRFSPIRFAVETFDSIEVITNELIYKDLNYE